MSLDALTHLQLDPTSQCDLTCVYCVGRHWKQAKADLGQIERMCEAAAPLRYVHLQGEGEPFVHRDFLAMVERVRATGAEVGFITNGRHFSAANVERLLALGVRSVGVSVDSLDPAVYRRLRQGELAPVLEGVRRLVDARPDSRAPDVYLTAVLTRSTFDGLADIVAYSETLGLSPPSAQPLQTMESYREHYPPELLEEHLTDEQQQALHRYWQEREVARDRLGLRTYFEDLFADDGSDRCPFLSHSLHIRFDGHVFPCCFMKEERDALGHIGRDDLVSLWNGDRRRSLREGFAAGQVPAPCEGCSVLSRPRNG